MAVNSEISKYVTKQAILPSDVGQVSQTNNSTNLKSINDNVAKLPDTPEKVAIIEIQKLEMLGSLRRLKT